MSSDLEPVRALLRAKIAKGKLRCLELSRSIFSAPREQFDAVLTMSLISEIRIVDEARKKLNDISTPSHITEESIVNRVVRKRKAARRRESR